MRSPTTVELEADLLGHEARVSAGAEAGAAPTRATRAPRLPSGPTNDPPPDVAGASFARQGALTFVFSVLTLGTNLVTGVVIARALGAEGRGALTAILTVTQMVGWAFALGCSEATAYRESRHGRNDGVLSAWLVLTLPAGLLAVGAGEALLPAALHAQSESTLRLAQLFMPTAFFVPIGLLTIGILLGTHRFLFYNLVLFLQPALTGVVYLALWLAGALTPTTALMGTAIVSLSVPAVATAKLVVGRITRPDWSAAWPSVWYGVRAHGTNLGGMMNSRLDLLIIPAFLTASSVGLYSSRQTSRGSSSRSPGRSRRSCCPPPPVILSAASRRWCTRFRRLSLSARVWRS